MLSTSARVIACLKSKPGTYVCASCIAQEIGSNVKAVYEAIRYVGSPIRSRLSGVIRDHGKCSGPCGGNRSVVYMRVS